MGEEGNRPIQTIFNQYFNNKADSLEFFMKIKQLFDEINFEDRANYKSKKIYEGKAASARHSTPKCTATRTRHRDVLWGQQLNKLRMEAQTKRIPTM